MPLLFIFIAHFSEKNDFPVDIPDFSQLPSADDFNNPDFSNLPPTPSPDNIPDFSNLPPTPSPDKIPGANKKGKKSRKGKKGRKRKGGKRRKGKKKGRKNKGGRTVMKGNIDCHLHWLILKLLKLYV